MNRNLMNSLIRWTGALCLGASLSGCSPSYTTDDASPVNFVIVTMNQGVPLKSDVLTSDGVENDQVLIQVGVRSKNPNLGADDHFANAVQVERYEIKYRRRSGRRRAGCAVHHLGQYDAAARGWK
jgi:hypothetical protein